MINNFLVCDAPDCGFMAAYRALTGCPDCGRVLRRVVIPLAILER